MFKLLTEKSEKKVRHEYAIRRAAVMLIGVIGILVLGTVGIFPSYILSNARYDEMFSRAEIMHLSEVQGERNEMKNWLKETRSKLDLLSPERDTDRPQALFDIFLDNEMEGVRVTSVTWKRNKDKVVITVSGIASDRQKLLSFERSINSSEKFVEVSLPVSQFAKERDIDFQISTSPVADKKP